VFGGLFVPSNLAQRAKTKGPKEKKGTYPKKPKAPTQSMAKQMTTEA